MQIQELLSHLGEQNKYAKIIYPNIDDQRAFDAIKTLFESGDTPVICGKKQELERYKNLIDAGLLNYQVPEDEKNEVFAAKLLGESVVDGFVGGNISTSREIIQALIKHVPVKEDISRISSHFLFGKDDDLFLYSDGGIQIDPNAQQLAEIGYLTILSAISYGIQPRVAMLSFSTAGSGGEHPKVLKIREATQILREKLKVQGMSDIPVEGEMQFDAAIIPEIGQRKNPNTKLKTSANVFIFPDVDSANISYKITERLGGYIALGPILQGLKKPGNDLSRGCSTQDIIATHYITKNQ